MEGRAVRFTPGQEEQEGLVGIQQELPRPGLGLAEVVPEGMQAQGDREQMEI